MSQKLVEKLKNDITDSMKNGQHEIKLTLRSIMAVAQSLAKINNVEVTDQHIIDAATKCKKEAAESIEIYKNLEGKVAEDNYLRAYRLNELSSKYLPTQMSEDEIEREISRIVSQTNASSMKEMGKVMGVFTKDHPKGTFDGALVSKVVKEKLS